MRHVPALLALGLAVLPSSWNATASAAVPSTTNSFYVPQAGLDYSNPTEGSAAIPNFRACPNNDGGSSLPLNARIKVVVRDAHGSGITGIAAGDVCMLFNGGTPSQGFNWPGADSIIANSTFNQNPLCPDVRCVAADGPTDANGATYITFTGPGGVRDPVRKWGHFDAELPVYVLGFKISGRLTSVPGSEPYVLQIKNFDVTGGLGPVPLNSGEAVSAADLNSVVGNFGLDNMLSYWRDFDSHFGVDLADVNMAIGHFGHNCATPLNP